MADYIVAGFITLMAFLSFRIGKQILSTYQHVDEDTLRDFWNGRLEKGSTEHRRVITHLGHCEKCRDLFDQIRKGKPLEDHLID